MNRTVYHSILEKVLEKHKDSPFKTLRGVVLRKVRRSDIEEMDKRRIIYNIWKQDTEEKLLKYLYNSLLYFEGLSVNAPNYFKNRY